jgi:hypothetical protein
MKRSSRGYGLLQAASNKNQQRKAAISDWTNDSQDGGDNNESSERIEIRNGYPVRFKCLDVAPEASVDANLLTVYFDYELTMPRDSASTFTENMQALEWSVLWNIVDTIGLGKCDFEKQTLAMSSQQGPSRRKVRTRRLTQDDGLDSSPSYILSMTSDPEDEIDTDSGKDVGRDAQLAQRETCCYCSAFSVICTKFCNSPTVFFYSLNSRLQVYAKHGP